MTRAGQVRLRVLVEVLPRLLLDSPGFAMTGRARLVMMMMMVIMMMVIMMIVTMMI